MTVVDSRPTTTVAPDTQPFQGPLSDDVVIDLALLAGVGALGWWWLKRNRRPPEDE